MIIYLLHFNTAINHKQHYIGITYNLEKRLKEHATGGMYSSHLCEYAFFHGITFQLGNSWKGDPDLEKKLKKEGHTERHCNICIKNKTGLVPPEAG